MLNIKNEINQLNFENFLWLIFIIIAILNITADNDEKEYLKTKNNIYKNKANKIFNITLKITFLIYIYFFIRNFNAYEKSSLKEKKLYAIKLLGSSFLIAGILCLIYFQNKNSSFIGSPAE